MRHTQELLILFLQYMTEILFFCVYICYSVLCVVASATTAAIVTATAYCFCHCDRHCLLLLLPLCLPLPACRSCSSFVRSFGKLKYIIFPQSKLYYFSFLSVCLYVCICVCALIYFFLFLALDKTLIFFSFFCYSTLAALLFSVTCRHCCCFLLLLLPTGTFVW